MLYIFTDCPVLKKVYQKTVTFMQPKVYLAMQRVVFHDIKPVRRIP